MTFDFPSKTVILQLTLKIPYETLSHDVSFQNPPCFPLLSQAASGYWENIYVAWENQHCIDEETIKQKRSSQKESEQKENPGNLIWSNIFHMWATMKL